MNMEHLFAQPSGTLFKGHRGSVFNKVIQITTNKPLSFAVKIPPNAECEITVRERNAQVIALIWRTLTIMWINVAATNPGSTEDPMMDVEEYLQQVLPDQMPDVLLITSTGHGFNAAHLPAIMRTTGFSMAYEKKVGLDKGVFCASFTGLGEMWLDQHQGDNIENGVVIEYNWF